MKKLILFALAAMPLFAFSQDKGNAAVAPPKPNESKFAIANPEVIFVELIVGTNSAGAQTIRADFGREIVAAISDKDLAKQLSEMRTMAFPSVPDAMNYLAAQGYKFQQNYVTWDKEGKGETHIVFEKRMARKQPQDGTVKPRPERTETKPADGKTPERQPAVRPTDKEKK